MRRTPPPPLPFHPSRPGLVRPIRVSPETGLTAAMARGPDWRSSSHGLYVPVGGGQVRPVEQRIVEASMVCPPQGAITGWAALRWLTGAYFTGTYAGQELPIPMIIGRRGFSGPAGIAPSWEHVLPWEITEVDGVRVTVPEFSATFAARHAVDGVQAVQALDIAMMFDLTSIDELTDFRVRRLSTTTGIAQLDAALCLASENCWSPPEVTKRLLWEIELGLRRPLCNRPVFDLDGRKVGTPDLIDPVAGVVGEYNGASHDDPERKALDVTREQRFRGLGLEVVTMTSDDLPGSNAYLDRVEAAYYRAERKAGRPRQWTTALPTYWVPTHTVALRRALTPEQRDRFLGWQRLPLAG